MIRVMIRAILEGLLFLFLFKPSTSYALVNGKKIISDIPIVQLFFANNSHICSGVFIDSYTILTAAHCISDQNTWDGFSLKVDRILDSKGEVIPVKQMKNIPHPNFKSRWYGNFNDVGLIKTTKYNFYGQYPTIATTKSVVSNKGILYGCGKISFKSNTRKCLMGENSFSKVFRWFLSWGKSKGGTSSTNDQIGIDVSIAPNDSGGPMIDKKTNQIIGVLRGTYLSFTSKWSLPNPNLITSLLQPENNDFIKLNLGAIK